MKNVFQSEEDLRNLNCNHMNDLKWTSHCSCTVKCKRGNVETSHAGKCADQSCDNLSWFKEELDVVKQDNEMGHACFPFCGDGIKKSKIVTLFVVGGTYSVDFTTLFFTGSVNGKCT